MRKEKLSDLLDISIGRTPSRNEPAYWGEGHLWVSIRDLSSKIVIETKEQITDLAVKESRCKIVKKGTLLFSFKLTIGKMAFAGLDLFTNEAIAAFLIKDKTKLNSQFLYYALQSATYGGSNQAVMGKTLNSKSLAEIKIPLPPLDDQKRIAHLLGKVEGMIARRKQHLQQLDELLKSVFLEMFGDPVRNEKGWEKIKVDDFAEVRIGPFGSLLHSEDYIENGIPLINPSHMIDGEIVPDKTQTITFEKYRELESYQLKINDIVVARRGEIGRCALVRVSTPLFCGTGSMFIRITSNYYPMLLQYQIYNTSLKGYLLSKAKGVTMKNLNSTTLGNLQVLNPPITLQKQFAAIVEKVESLKSRYQSSLSNLQNLYGALSQKAFKGELDLGKVPLPVEEEKAKPEEVPVLPFDEGLSETMKKTLADLNKFNNSSDSLRALQEAASINFDSSAMEAAKILAEQARLWKSPLDELKNMSSVARAMEELVKPSAIQQIAKEQLEAFQHTSKLARQLAASMPKIDTSFLEQQRKLMESASRPFMEMQKTLANLNLTRTTLSGVLDDSEAVARRFQTAIPDYASWQKQYSTPEGIDTETEEEEEPKRIFTRYDITDVITATEGVTFEDLTVKLTEIESIDLPSYERIRSILFEMLGEGVLKQQFDEESQSLKLRLAE